MLCMHGVSCKARLSSQTKRTKLGDQESKEARTRYVVNPLIQISREGECSRLAWMEGIELGRDAINPIRLTC